MTNKESFFELIDAGREGKNIGLSTGSKKLELYMDGYLNGTSYLVGGASGVGKSTYALWAYIYCPLMDFLSGHLTERDPYWIMFALEMTPSQIYAKLASMYIYDKFGVQLRFKEIFSRGEDCILSDEHYELIKEINDFLDVLDQRIYFKTGQLTEKVYIKVLNEQLTKFGKFENEKFIPNNSQQIVGVMIDHCSLITATPGRTKKDEMDAISKLSVMLRNTTGIVSPIHIAQFNRSANSDERLKQGMQLPSDSDFKDSGALFEDSQVVTALFSPHKFKLATWNHYSIKDLEQGFIAIFLLKSRFGTSDLFVPFGFYGDCSHYKELPKPDQINDYEKYKNPDWSLVDEAKELQTDSQNSNFKFTM